MSGLATVALYFFSSQTTFVIKHNDSYSIHHMGVVVQPKYTLTWA